MKLQHFNVLLFLAGLVPAIYAQAGYLYGVSTSTNSVYNLDPVTGAANLVSAGSTPGNEPRYGASNENTPPSAATNQ